MRRFPVVNGGYSGTQKITLNGPTRLFVHPRTHQIVHDPDVMAGCCLTINATPAHPSMVQELASTKNLSHVIGTPIMVLANGAVHSQELGNPILSSPSPTRCRRRLCWVDPARD